MQRYRHDPSKNLVGFVVGDVEYAVAITHVKEISNPLRLVALPHAPRSVIGVADYRGEVVAVVDLRMRFGMPAAPVTRKTKWIVVDVGARAPDRGDGSALHAGMTRAPESGQGLGFARGGRLVALVVDAVTDVFGTGGADLRPAPALGGGEDARGIAGVTTHSTGADHAAAKTGAAPSGLVFVLDTARLRDLADALAATHGESPSAAASLSLPARTVT
jgi:purine-binding chemotaxis protein CheW